MSGANLENADLSRADLRDANLSGAKLLGANLSNADLRGANLADTDLRHVLNLKEAKLEGVRLCHVDLSGVNLKSAVLTRADLSASNLKRAALDECDLLFFSIDSHDIWAKLKPVLLNRPIMTVSEIPGFAQQGGIVEYEFDRSAQKMFMIFNMQAMRDAGLVINARLLALDISKPLLAVSEQ